MGLENPDFLPCLQGDSQAARDVYFGVAIMAAFRPGDWRRAVQEAGGWTKIIASGHPFGTLNDVVSQYRLGISILSMSPGVIHVLVLQWRYKEMNMAGCHLNFSSRHVIIFCPPLTR